MIALKSLLPLLLAMLAIPVRCADMLPFSEWEHLRVDTGNVSIHVRYHGTGPPLLLVHGYPEHSLTWTHIGPILASKNYTVIAPDLRGIGDSGIPKSYAFDAESCAEDIYSVLKFLNIKSLYAFAHDKGSGVLSALVAKYRDEITFARFGLSEYPLPGFGYELNWSPSYTWNLYSNWQLAFFSVPDAAQYFIAGREREMLSWYFFHSSYSGTASFTTDLLTQYADSIAKLGYLRSGLELFSTVNVEKDAMFFRRTLKTRPFAQPLLVLGGEASFAPASLLRQFFDPITSNLTVDVVPKAGHWIADENPDWVARRILHFLSVGNKDVNSVDLNYLKDKNTLKAPPMY